MLLSLLARAHVVVGGLRVQFIPIFPLASKSTFLGVSHGLLRAFVEPCRAFPRIPSVYIPLGEVWFVSLVSILL